MRINSTPLIVVITLLIGIWLGNYLTWFGGDIILGPQQRLPNGGIYQGDLKDGQLHGQGKLTWANGDYYEGQFADGLFSGQGVLVSTNGLRFEGEFKAGRFHGKGKLETDNFSYEGEFVADRMEGHGKLIHGEMEYEGAFVNDKRQGKGRQRFPNKDRYEGDFANDSPNGQGVFRLASGGVYKGSVKDGRFHGEGKYSNEGHRYHGYFESGQFTGMGSYEGAGWHYEGEFKDWRYHGAGKLKTPRGVYQGIFEDGDIHGLGSFTGKNGESYEGEFRYGRYEGKGTYEDENGVYIGEFADGLYHGKGELKRNEPLDGISVFSGRWEYGRLAESETVEVYSDEELAEQVIYSQEQQLAKAFSSLSDGIPGQVETFALLVAGDGKEEVFRREVETISEKIASNGIPKTRQVLLVNTRKSGKQYPVATRISIDRALKALSERMNEEDILLLYLTSHGSDTHELAFNHRAVRVANITPEGLKKSLDALPIRWKVAVISACYSGGYVDPLKSDDTLVITAAAEDRKSFGCSDENTMTRFGQAYFEESFDASLDFVRFYHEARAKVKAWEKSEGYKESLPQIACSKAIYEQIAQQSNASVNAPFAETQCRTPAEPKGLLDSIKSLFN